MAEPCERCGASHEGDCPAAPAAAPAAEACAFCGERHPREVSCARWAQQSGSGLTAVYSGITAGERAEPLVLPRRPRRSPGNTHAAETLALRIGMGVLALIGMIALARAALGLVGGGSRGSSADLPACNLSRIRANLSTAATIESEASAAVPGRVAATNALLLAPSADCSQQVYLLYSAYLDNAALCLSLSAPASCQARDAVHTQLNQALENGQ